MIKKADEALNFLPPKIPAFLEENVSGKKRAKGSDGSSKILFESSWGFCAQDSVLGSPPLASFMSFKVINFMSRR